MGGESFGAIQNVRTFYQVEINGLKVAGEMAFQIQESRRIFVYSLTTEDPNEQVAYIEQARAATDSVERLNQELLASQLDAASRQTLTNFSRSWNEYLKIRDQVIASILLGEKKPALLLDFSQAHPAFERAKTSLTRLETELDRSASERLGYVTRALYRSMGEIVVLLAAMLVFLKTVGASLERRRTVETLRKINSELHASEARKSAIMNSALDSVITVDGVGRIIEFNPAAERTFGYLRDEILGRELAETIIPPAFRDAHRRGMAHFLSSGEGPVVGRRIEMPALRADGREFPCELAISRVDYQGTFLFTAYLRDLSDRKQTEERLRILSSAVEQSPVSILITDLHGKIEYVNAKLIQSTGYEFEELKGQDPGILTSRDMPPGHFKEISEAIQAGEWQGVVRTKRKDGGGFSESVKILRIRDKSGAPTHTLALAEDITERLEMEAAVRFSEERFRIAAESSGDSIYQWDLKTDTITFFGGNQRHLADSGWKPPGTGQEFLTGLHAGDRERVKSALLRSIRTGERFSEEFRILQPDGGTRYWLDQGAVLRDKEGRPSMWIGVWKDITEDKKVERANADLAAIVECADVAIIRKDLDDNVITWNKGAERIYGYSPEEAIGQTMKVLVPPERAGEDTAMKEMVKGGENVNHYETVRLTKSGELIHVLLTISPIRDRGGMVTGMALVAWDITQVKKLESQLAQAQKLESIGQLAAGIAHEINTPIQYIGDNAKFLEESFRDLVKFAQARGGPGDSLKGAPSALVVATREAVDESDVEYLRGEIPKAIEQLLEGVDHVARIVRAMKEFSHPGPVEKMPMDINRAIESTILVSRNEWRYVAELTTDLDHALPPVPCIAGELNQVILNLIVNAAHAISDANKERRGKGSIHISTRKVGPGIEIRVSDTGCGIPKAIQSKVFDPFFTTKPVGKGTGQGLAIAHSVIVQKHSGTIQFESEPGSGTTFVIHLPLECELEAA